MENNNSVENLLTREELQIQLERSNSALQQVEAEIKIEAALEQVRASGMAMQKSEELAQSANVLFQQMESLGIPAWSTGYCIWADDKLSGTYWMSSMGILQPPFTAPMTENSMFMHCREACLGGETFYAEEFSGNELEKHYQYMGDLPSVKDMLDKITVAGVEVPSFPLSQVNHNVYFSKGFLLFVTLKPVPEAHEIFKRFGKVFDQTYTRFLDLQKAEAQARESEIQLALERVRARTMAVYTD